MHARAVLRLSIPACAAAGLVLLVSSPAGAYDRWNDCETCHGGFRTSPYAPPSGAAAWPDDLHDVHRNASYMGTGCDVCHETGTRVNPRIGASIEDANGVTPGAGCAGCHGEVDGTGGSHGYGLRLRHAATGAATCSDATCHTGDPTPAPESAMPRNYGGTLTLADAPCNPAPDTLEDWSGDGVGLDNDGDTLFDGADPDCAAGCTDDDTDGYSPDGGSCGPVDCDDALATVHPGATEECNGVDDNCDGATDEGCAADADADADADAVDDVPVDADDVPAEGGADADAVDDVPADVDDVPIEGGADADAAGDVPADVLDVVGDGATDAAGDGGPPPEGDGGGCGCSAARGDGAFGLLLLLGVALLVRRRRA